MLDAPLSPAQEAGEAIRQGSTLRWWVDARQFYRALLGKHSYTEVGRLVALTLAVWDHPERYS